MFKIENRIKINKSRELVFNFLSDLENIPLWNYFVNDVRKISSDDDKTFYHQVRQNDSQTIEVQKQHFPDYIMIKTTNEEKIRFTRIFNLNEDNNGNCILEDYFEIDLGYPRILQEVFNLKIKKAVKENLVRLKDLLEFKITVLQDGRVSKLTLQN